MIKIFNSALDINQLFLELSARAKEKNCGACAVFVGIVRSENNISALSFDIYEPILKKWFQGWQKHANEIDAEIFMAHSNGDVKVGESSFFCAIISPNRKSALEIYEDFIEDFKKNAPIWKYDIIDGARIFAKNRSHLIKGAGILDDKNN